MRTRRHFIATGFSMAAAGLAGAAALAERSRNRCRPRRPHSGSGGTRPFASRRLTSSTPSCAKRISPRFRYLPGVETKTPAELFARGEADFDPDFSPIAIVAIDA
jgi:hypothetical protein